MAVLRSFLKEQGISAGGVLWLDGKVSSEKTELAIMCVPYIWGQIGQEEDGNDTVNATAIITGEFFKEQMSTVSRILYLNVGNFLEVEKNSQDLELLQRNRDYLAAFMRYFIQWLIRKVEQEEYHE